MKTIQEQIDEKKELQRQKIIEVMQADDKDGLYESLADSQNVPKYKELGNIADEGILRTELSALKSQLKDENDFPEIDFRKDIANELSRDELINRLCEMNESYQKMRKEWFEKCIMEKQIIGRKTENAADNLKKLGVNKTAEEILAKEIERSVEQITDGLNVTSFQAIRAMNKFASQFQEQPITDMMIEKWIDSYLSNPVFDYKLVGDENVDETSVKRFIRYGARAGAKWALSLKAQKAQPGDEENCEHNNTDIRDIRCNICLDCGKVIETNI